MVALCKRVWEQFRMLPVHPIDPLAELVSILYLLHIFCWLDGQYNPA